VATGSNDELIRRLALIIGIGTIAMVSIWITAPFLPAVLWAGTIAVATWPVLRSVQSVLGGRRWAATTILTLALILGFFLPLVMVMGALVEHAGLARDLIAKGLPVPPVWVEKIPVVGRKIEAQWSELAQLDETALRARLEPALTVVSRWLLGTAGSLLRLVGQVLLTSVVTALFYAKGEDVAAGLRAFFRRVGGDSAEALVVLAGGAARGVALGVVVTALLQALLTGIALALTGVPGAGILGGVALVLCLAQVGPLLLLVPSVAWLYSSQQTTAATILAVASIGLISMDNILRPILITRGANLPILLVFVGVIGGMLTFGIIGIFIGPVVLAVCWTLLQDWVRQPAPVTSSQS
jgi:predicted PurR-regulated permease PerM